MGTTPAEALSPGALAAEGSEERSLAYAGMVIFLGSWAMMFAALFFSYAVLRASAPIWPTPGFPPLPLLLPGINTFLLLASSVVLARALAQLRHGQLKRARRGLLGTLALGVAFVALQCLVWSELWRGGLRLHSGAYGGTFYVLTVFHVLHVIVGLGLLVGLLVPLARATLPGRVRCALTLLFWHFVDAVWLVTFVAVYLL